jgi:hypothetical protein
MKKILLSALAGLVVIILLTPFLLGQIMSSGMLSWVEKQKVDGIILSNIEQESGYLESEVSYDLEFDKRFVAKNSHYAIGAKWIDGLGVSLHTVAMNLPVSEPAIALKLISLPKQLTLLSPLLNAYPLTMKLHSKKLKTFKGDLFIGDIKLNDSEIVIDTRNSSLYFPFAISAKAFEDLEKEYPLLGLLRSSAIIVKDGDRYESIITLNESIWQVNGHNR